MTQAKPENGKPDKQNIRTEAEVVLAYARSQLVDLQLSLALASNDALRGQLAGAVGNLSDAVRQLSRAVHSSSVSASDIAALAQAVQASSGPTATGDGTTLVASDKTTAEAKIFASAACTRQETQSVEADMYDRKIFDPYLRFSSPQDEAEYRQREAENKKYIDAQLAKRTPEGDLNASGGAIDGMLDAHAHGAGNSPDFQSKWNSLTDTAKQQRDVMQAAGQSTAEFDQHVTAGVTRYLKAKGLTDNEINARLAASSAPLDTVKPYINGNDQSGKAHNDPAPQSPSIDAIAAQLKAAGLSAPANANSDPAHGLALQNTPSAGGQALTSFADKARPPSAYPTE